MAGYGLSVKDKKGCDAMGLPLVKIGVQAALETSQAGEGGEKRFVGWLSIELKPDIIRSVDGNGAPFELGDRMAATSRR